MLRRCCRHLGAFERRMPPVVEHRPQGHDYRRFPGMIITAGFLLAWAGYHGYISVDIKTPTNDELDEWLRKKTMNEGK